jgi:hypothetical protein
MNYVLASMLIIVVIMSAELSEAIITGGSPDVELVHSYVRPSTSFYVGEVNASEVLRKIQSGESVIYDHVIIKGNISLNQSGMKTKYINFNKVYFMENEGKRGYDRTDISGNFAVIDSFIRINNSLIEGNIDFDKVIFQAQNISFNNTKVLGKSSFTNSLFNGTAYFVNTNFNHSASFNDSSFMQPVFFVYSEFDGSADFIGAGFNGFASFWKSAFYRSADFRVASFYEDVNFIYT